MAKRRANGEGSLYQRKDGTWTAQYTDCNGKKRYLYGKTQKVVKEKLDEIRRQSSTGLIVDSKNMRFADWMAEWLEVYARPSIKTGTYANYYFQVHNLIIPAFHGILLKDLNEEALQRFINTMTVKRNDGKSGGYSSAVIAGTRVRLYSALDKAIDRGLISRNPAEKLKTPRVAWKEKSILTVEEQKRFEAYLTENLDANPDGLLFLLMMYTGLRPAEVGGLKISDIDFTRGELHVCRAAVRDYDPVAKKVIVKVSTPKTQSSKRTIPLSAFAVSLLRRAIEERESKILLFENILSHSERFSHFWKDDFIFYTVEGSLFTSVKLRDRIKVICKKAGLDFISPHALRHTFATRWIEAGLDVKTLSEILGHTNAAITLNIYTHSLEEQKRNSINKLSEFMSRGDGEIQ